MAAYKTKRGTTSYLVDVWIGDSTSTTGAGKTGLAYNTASLAMKYQESDAASGTTATLATMTEGTWTSGGFVESNIGQGWYQVGIPNAAIDSGTKTKFILYGATGMVPTPFVVELDAIDYQDSVRAGLTALPNAAADAAGGLPISDAGGLDLDNRMPAAAAITNLNTVFNTDFANNYNTSADKWKVDITHASGTAVTATGGRLEVDTTHWGGVVVGSAVIQVDIDTIKGQSVTCAAPVTIGVYVGGTGAAALEATAQSILTDTAEIGAAGAGLTALASATDLATVDTNVDAIKAKTDQFVFTIANQVDANALSGGGGLDAAGVRAAIGLSSANLDTQLAAIDDYIDTEIGTLQNTATNTYNIVNNGTYGNSAIKTAVDALAPASDVSGSFNQTYGTVISGTYANTATDDNTRHVLAPDATNALDADYTFTIPTENKPTRVTINGYFNGTAQYAEVYAYNYDTAAYVQLSNSTTRMNTRSSDTNYTYELSRDYVEDGVGTVKIRFTSPSTNTAHRLHLDRILLYSLTEAGTEAGLTAANVWEYATRTVTAATNITSDGNTISQTQLAYLDAAVSTRLATAGYTAPLDAAGTRSAVGLASANLDTQLSTIDTNVDSILDDTGTTGVVVASGSKTGYSLASTGLDSISTTAPSGVASNFREMLVQVWRRFFKKTVYDNSANTIKTYADDGATIVTTQTATSAAGVETQGPAT